MKLQWIPMLLLCVSCSSGQEKVSSPDNKIDHEAVVSQARTQPQDNWHTTLMWQAKQSAVILHGKITNVVAERGRTAHGDTYVESTVSIEVSEMLKGSSRRIGQFRCLGGVVDGLVYSYSSLPIFSEGEEVIVFLEIIDGIPVVPVGWDAPKLTLLPDRTLTPSRLGLSELLVLVSNAGEQP